MGDDRKDSGISINSFFARRKLPLTTQDECDAFVRARYSEETIEPAPFQGYCSYTVLVGEETVIQFRPSDHGLDIDITSKAYEIFGSLAPKTQFLGRIRNADLCVYSMTRLSGISLQDMRASIDSSRIKQQREQLVKDFAQLQVKSWNQAVQDPRIETKGKVGSSLRWRLELMRKGMPLRFRPFASQILRDLGGIERLPWILTHGDFIPANILVSPESGEMIGLIDWAEAEYLPFGVGLYGLEELLGESTSGRFDYYSEAGHLRQTFWQEMTNSISALRGDATLMKAAKTAQVLGVMLWHGIAFDDGKLNRAVEAGIDDEEIQRLDEQLLGSSGPYIRRQRRSALSILRDLLFGKR